MPDVKEMVSREKIVIIKVDKSLFFPIFVPSQTKTDTMKTPFTPFVLVLAVMLAASATAFAQSKLKEPEFVGEAAFVKPDSSTVLLEKEMPHYTTKASASMYITGMGKLKTRVVVNNLSSPVRVAAGVPLDIIVNCGGNAKDPATIIQVFRLVPRKGHREAEIASTGSFTGTKTGDLIYVQFTGRKFGTNSYILHIDKVAPGEYGVGISDNNNVIALFGADK